ncbi:MAG TPA: hypothetical protein VF370_01515 [Candidatus Cryosericum sp.]
MQKQLRIKSVSVEDFTKFGFCVGIVLAIGGNIAILIFPTSRVTAGIPFFTYNATRSFSGILIFSVLAVLSSTLDLLLAALFSNLVLKLSKGISIEIEE